MILDIVPPCVVASMVYLARFGLMKHNSYSKADDRSVFLFCETKLCWAGKRSLSCSALFILAVHNSFSWTINGDISVKVASSEDVSEYTNTPCVWLEREYENLYTVSRLTLYNVRFSFLT